jgi:hypothetical protein
MRRMSGTDSLFISGETPNWHQHAGGLAILDAADVPGFGFDDVLRTVSGRLALIPKLTWKLKPVPLGLDRAVWVDDADFDIRRHLHHITVRAPADSERPRPRSHTRTVALDANATRRRLAVRLSEWANRLSGSTPPGQIVHSTSRGGSGRPRVAAMQQCRRNRVSRSAALLSAKVMESRYLGARGRAKLSSWPSGSWMWK